MFSEKVHVIAVEFDATRAVSITFADPQRDNPVATEITVLQISPERYAEELNSIVDELRTLIDKVQVDIRNPPQTIRRR